MRGSTAVSIDETSVGRGIDSPHPTGANDVILSAPHARGEQKDERARTHAPDEEVVRRERRRGVDDCREKEDRVRGEEDGDRGEQPLEPHHQLRPRGGVCDRAMRLAVAVSGA